MKNDILDNGDSNIFNIRTSVDSSRGKLPISAQDLKNAPSGDIFGAIQSTGMGAKPADVNKKQFLILSTLGGLRSDAGKPIAAICSPFTSA